MKMIYLMVSIVAVACIAAISSQASESSTTGWKSLFNKEDLSGWEYPEDGPWAVVDGTIDCDAARAPGVIGDLWSEKNYADFVLYVEWRLKDTPTVEQRPLIGEDGREKTDADGKVKTVEIHNADSGIYLRGQKKAQVNIWNWPVGSGEVWGYRTNESMPDEVRRAVTPNVRADNEPGEWNTYVITMIGDRLSVVLNGEIVINNAQLIGVAEEGPIGLQFHGGYNPDTKSYKPASSLVQFRKVLVKPLK